MKKKGAGKIGVESAAVAGVEAEIRSNGRALKYRRKNLLERWRRLATGLRGARLFRVTVAVGGRVFWAVECTLSGAQVCRRFASELHARAWLTMATQSRAVLSSVERQELDRPCSTSYLASDGW